MNELHQESCVPIRQGKAQALTDEALKSLLEELPAWLLEHRDSTTVITRIYLFKRYIDALRFVQNLGEQAQAEDHHPVMVVEWGRVGVTWWTHTLNGVHRNDAIMAARSDQIYAKISH